jgi:hypothetical protein
MSDWLPDSKLLIFQRYTSSLVTVPRLSHFVLASHISSLGCHLPRPTSHASGSPVQGLSKWSWQSSSAIVVAAYSMGARHLRVSDVPKSEQVFLTLLEVAGRTFSWEVRRSKFSNCSPREGILIYPVFGHPSNYQGTHIMLMKLIIGLQGIFIEFTMVTICWPTHQTLTFTIRAFKYF